MDEDHDFEDSTPCYDGDDERERKLKNGWPASQPQATAGSSQYGLFRKSWHGRPRGGTRRSLTLGTAQSEFFRPSVSTENIARRGSLKTDSKQYTLPHVGNDDKCGYLEKFKLNMLTRTRRNAEKFYFRLTKAYFQYHDTIMSSVPKRCEVRMKIIRVHSVKGCGFVVHFRNGTVWHLAASNQVDKIEWMEAILPGSSQAVRVVGTQEWIDGPPDPPPPVQTSAQPTAGASTSENRHQVAPTIGRPRSTHLLGNDGPVAASASYDDVLSELSSMEEDPDLLERILDESAATVGLSKMIKKPPPLPQQDYYTRPPASLPSEGIECSEYMQPRDEPEGLSYYTTVDYETSETSGMVDNATATVEIPVLAVCDDDAPDEPLDQDCAYSQKFLNVANEEKTVLSLQLRSNTKHIQTATLEISKPLGKGNFGAVHLGLWSFRENCQPIEVAVKSLRTGADEKAEKDFLAEASIMAEFDHPNIIRLFGVVDDMDVVPRIVTEYMANGSLHDFLTRIRMSEPTLRSIAQLLQYLVDIACGLQYMCAEGFIHRDLAARNVLVSDDERCKITDFGLSRKLAEDSVEYMSTGGLLPLKWTAPEAGMHKCFSEASDVWSFGVTCWEVLTFGKKPYAQLTFFTLFQQLQKGVRLGQPRNCPDKLYELMKRCWEWERAKRPSCDEISRVLKALLAEVYVLHGKGDDTEDSSDTDV